MKFVIVFLLCISSPVKADDWFFRYAANQELTVKSFSIGETFNAYFLNHKLEAGGLWDNRGTNGFNPYFAIGTGVAPQLGKVFLEFHQSIAAFSNPDGTYMSSHFEFMEDLGIGFRGKRDESLVFGYKHISNGGVVPPNLGVDLFNMSVRFPL